MKVTGSSTITCPVCGGQKNVKMSTDACLFFYKCENCKTILKPRGGDCCVFARLGRIIAAKGKTRVFNDGNSADTETSSSR